MANIKFRGALVDPLPVHNSTTYAGAPLSNDDIDANFRALNNGKLELSGGTMTGDINFQDSGEGITWTMASDNAYIKFFNTGDADTNSRLEYGTGDNSNEFHRWMISTSEGMNLKSDALNVTVGKISIGSSGTYMQRNSTTGCIEFYC